MSVRKMTAKFSMDTSEYVDGAERIKTVNRQLTVQSKEAKKEIEELMKTGSKGDNGLVKVTERQIEAIKQTDREAKKSAKAINVLTKQTRDLTRMTSMSADEQEIYVAQMRLGSQATDQQRDEVARLITEQQGLRKSTGQTTKSFALAKGGMANMQYQLQDVIVTAQMGQSVFTILSQQGSQMAMSFGPKGAMVGTVLTLGGAIGGVLYSALKGTGDEMEEFSYNAKEMRGDLEALAKLTESQAIVGMNESAKSMKGYGDSISDSLIKIRELEASLAESDKTIIRGARGYTVSAEEIKKQSDKKNKKINADIASEEANRDKLIKQLQEEGKAYAELENVAVGGRTIAKSKAINEMIEALEEEVELYGKSAKEIAIWEAEKNKATKAEIAGIAAKHDSLKLLKDETKAKEESKEADKKGKSYVDKLKEELEMLMLNTAELKNYNIEKAAGKAGKKNKSEAKALLEEIQIKKDYKTMNAALKQSELDLAATKNQAMNSSLVNMQAMAEEGSALSKIIFLTQQGLSAGEVMMSAEAAKMLNTKTYAGMVGGAAISETLNVGVEAKKWASLGQIAATSIAGVFHGGGAVPENNGEQTYLLKGGEYVESEAERRDIDRALSGGVGGGNISVNYTIQALDAKGVEQVLMKNKTAVYNAVSKAMKSQGRKL